MRRLACLAALLVLPCLTACTEVGDRWYTTRDTGGGDDADVSGDADAEPAGPPTFADHVLPIFQASSCVTCHGGQGGLVVDSPEALATGGLNGPAVVACRPGEGTLLPKLSEDPPFGAQMPPAPSAPVPQAQRDVIARWIAAGAGQDVDCAEAGYTWEDDIEPLFAAAKCAEGFCHGAGAAGGLDLRTREGYFATGLTGQPAVVPCDPEAGSLVTRLRPEAGFGRMPMGGPYLDEADVLKVLAWIEQGAGQSCP